MQQVAIITGVPFTILLIGMGASLYKAVSEEILPEKETSAAPSQDGRPATSNTATERDDATVKSGS